MGGGVGAQPVVGIRNLTLVAQHAAIDLLGFKNNNKNTPSGLFRSWLHYFVELLPYALQSLQVGILDLLHSMLQCV